MYSPAFVRVTKIVTAAVALALVAARVFAPDVYHDI
jgi:hypothetical protein